MLMARPVNNHFRLGLLFAIGSAFTFGMSGPFAKSLMEAGWSPTAAVTARLAVGAVVMAIFATVVKPDWFREARQHAKTVVLYGLIPIAGAQLCYYNAVSHLSVACRSAARVHRTHPGRRLALGHYPAQAEQQDAGRRGLRRRRNHAGPEHLPLTEAGPTSTPSASSGGWPRRSAPPAIS